MSNIDFNRIPASYPSLCIPRAFNNITKDRVYRAFKDVDLGEIDHVDLVERTSDKGERYLRIFVHFRRWYNNRNAMIARDRVLDGKDIKIVYDDPSFWKVFKNSYDELPRENRDRDRDRHARLVIDDDRRDRRESRDNRDRRDYRDRHVSQRPRKHEEVPKKQEAARPRSPACSPPKKRPEPKVAPPEPKVAPPEPKVAPKKILLEEGEIDEEAELEDRYKDPENPDDDIYAGL